MNISYNSTLTDDTAQKIFQYSLYIFNGFFALIGSTLIIVVILRYRDLRSKEFYFLCGLAGGDVCQAIAFLYSGIRRLMLVTWHEDETVFVTPFQCMKEGYNSFFLFGQECSMMMTFCISLDRFLAIVAFKRYNSLGSAYSWGLISAVYLHALVMVALSWYAAFEKPQIPIYPLICLIPFSLPNAYFIYHSLVQLIPGLASMILYMWALRSLSVMANSHTDITFSSLHAVEKQRQAQMTKNVAIVIFYTFFSTTVPFGIVFFYDILGLTLSDTFTILAPYLWAVTCFDGGMNLFVYARKYPKFRQCLKKLLGMKSIVHPAVQS